MQTEDVIENEQQDRFIDEATFHGDVASIEALWQRAPIGDLDMPLIDIGQGEPLVFVSILEHLEYVYARQISALSAGRRVITYRRQESRTRFVGLAERAEELKRVLDSLELQRADFIGHGDGAMVLFEFAARYPARCRSLIIIAQGADYQIAPHPFIWLLHELFLRLPVEHFLPAWFLRRIVINYIVSNRPVGADNELSPSKLGSSSESCHSERSEESVPRETRILRCAQNDTIGATRITEFVGENSLSAPVPHSHDGVPRMLPQHLIEEQFRKIALWPFVYKFSVLPIIHNFDMRERLASLTMPVFLINRANDALSPEAKTRWLAENLPNCAGYHVISGGERFFMYAESELVNRLIEGFLITVKESK
ncbi:MAG TPA: alpha/beta hydrolase [Ktedonobacteraceae bacterium]|nr:alpha/beta hydrolase [Ktedonobacteraceae bacterium]